MHKANKRWRLILLVWAGFLIIPLSIPLYKIIKGAAFRPPDLPGQLLISTMDQLIVLHGTSGVQKVFEIPGLSMGEAYWAPDQTHIAFVANTDRQTLTLLDVSSHMSQLLNIDGQESACEIETFSWSPVDDRIAYVITGDSEAKVYVYTIANSSTQVVWECVHRCGTLLWSSDASQLVFPEIENPATPGDMHTTKVVQLDLDTKDPDTLFTVPGVFERISCRSDWERCALIDYSQGLFISDRDGNLEKIFDSVGSAVWSPDGRWLAFTAVYEAPSMPAVINVYDSATKTSFQLYPTPNVFGAWLHPDNQNRYFVFDWRE